MTYKSFDRKRLFKTKKRKKRTPSNGKKTGLGVFLGNTNSRNAINSLGVSLSPQFQTSFSLFFFFFFVFPAHCYQLFFKPPVMGHTHNTSHQGVRVSHPLPRQLPYPFAETHIKFISFDVNGVDGVYSSNEPSKQLDTISEFGCESMCQMNVFFGLLCINLF